MLTYCHAPARSCSRAIPCEDRALTIRGFPRPTPCREGCKGFLENGPSPNPSTREGSIIYCLMWALVNCNSSLPLWEGWGGVLGQVEGPWVGEGSARVQRTYETDLVINTPSVHIILLYLSLSRSILQSAKFVQYICKRKRKFPSFKFQVFPIMRAP